MSEEDKKTSDVSGLELILLLGILAASAYYSYVWASQRFESFLAHISFGVLGFVGGIIIAISSTEFIKNNPFLTTLLALAIGFYLGKYGLAVPVITVQQ